MPSIPQRLAQIRAEINQAEAEAGRKIGCVQLLAVSKTKPPADLAIAYRHGQRHFGESYLQEALIKQQALAGFDITWHFIGPIQSNKTRTMSENFTWVHSVDRLKIAKRLSEQRPSTLPPLNICLQVNISEETTKSGVSLEELPQLITAVNKLPNLRLRGVMAIPLPTTDFAQQREPYRRLVTVVKKMNLPQMDTFSFGMSGDLKAAITEGSTIVRIGTALFGARTYPPPPPQLAASKVT